MRRLVVLLCCLALAGPVSASAAGISLPPEWEGIWTEVDSVYDCNTQALIGVASRTDTLCAGEEIGRDPQSALNPNPLDPPPFPWVTCSGTGDVAHLQVHCSASGLCGEACLLDYTSDLDATRSGEMAFWLWTTSFYSNVPIFDSCSLTRRHGTRIQAGPLASCGIVPTAARTWGSLKARYR